MGTPCAIGLKQADGSVRVPEALVPYMGVDTIGPAR